MSSEAIKVLSKLRDFCCNYFKSGLPNERKAELCEELNKYILKIYGNICDNVCQLLDSESNVIPVEGQCYVFGDIHGNLGDVYDYEIMLWNSSDSNIRNGKFVFLGDFVDRGAFSTEVSLYLLSLKLLEPNRFILVRGNHEVRSVNKRGFLRECNRKYLSEANAVWNSINRCFERLPICAVINNRFFCCHGGVPKSVSTVDEIQQIVKPLIDQAVESPAAHELLWNDPIESMPTFTLMTERVLKHKRIEFIPNKTRSTGYYFTPSAAKRFLDTNGFSHMIRAHECVEEGHRYTSGDRVVTIFSSSNYCGKNNTPACAKVTMDPPLLQIVNLK